jgi:hypothetical protein
MTGKHSKQGKSQGKQDAQYVNDLSDHGYDTVEAQSVAALRQQGTAGIAADVASKKMTDRSRTNSEVSMLMEEERVFAPEMSSLESLNLEDSESVMWRKVG